MARKSTGVLFFLSFLLLALAGNTLTAQMTVTGAISGNVLDPSGQFIAGANVALTSEKTKEVHNTLTNGTGAFNFVAVQPGPYSLKVEHPGFKAAERTGVVVAANDHLAIGDIKLQIGATSDTISVEAQSATVQTDSTEHSASLTSGQLDNLTARGRDVVSMLRTIPGVQYQADQDSVGGNFGTNSPSIGGASNIVNSYAVDGVISNDLGSPSVFSSVTTLDAIGEVKVILNSYQAEYAGNGGAIMEVITKSGGRDFHGTGYYFLRNDALNANDFFNNRNNVKRPEYRYNVFGATIGGPIYIPGHWNRDRNKLFGFYNIEQWAIRIPGALTQYTMPTALERQGDFSQTLDLNGKVIPINDPTTLAQFQGNVIPQSRLNPNGQALLNVLPLPNFTNRAITGGNYNFQIQEVQKDPKRSQLFKFDYVPTASDRLYVRGKTWLAQQEGYNISSGATPTGFFGQCYCFTESGLAVVGTHIFSPSIVMEYNAGVRHNHEAWFPFGVGETDAQDLQRVLRTGIGYKLGQYFPQANAEGVIPKSTYGGVNNPPNVGFDGRLLRGGTDYTFNINDIVSVTRGSHLIKFGGDFYRIRNYEGESSNFSGTFDFGKNTQNPLDTNYAFSNAVLGVFNSYTESNARYGQNQRQSEIEWFLQDTWKVNKKLTVDAGMRWSWANSPYPRYDGQAAVLALSRYKASDTPPLFVPVTVNGLRQAQNPITGALLPQAYVGAFVPGVGNPAAGGVLSGDASYPRGFVNQPPVLWGPRLGFAYDPFGKGKTAIRAGAAILYTLHISRGGMLQNNPPAVFTPITNYGDMRTFLQTAGLLSPGNTQTLNVNNKVPDNYNLTFGVQQDLGHSLILDVSYLGVLGQHIQQTVQLNTVPYGARFLPQNQDPTSPGKPLPDNFFRTYPGYANVAISDNAYNSNYHALLLTLNRRFASGLQMGVTYTYSKYLDYSSVPVYRPLRTWGYGFNGADQTHNVAFNYSYQVPRASRLRNNMLVRTAFDGWVLSGISQFVSGSPAGISFSTVQGTDLTGGGDGQRVNVVGNPNANGSTFYAWFNPAAFAVPGKGDPGNAAKNSVRNPGVNNNDVALTKKFALKSDQRYFQFRWEAYNIFNHTQYSGINTAARFDLANGGAQTNALFGQVTSTRAPRVMQGTLRIVF